MRDAYPDLMKNVIEKTVIKDTSQQKEELKVLLQAQQHNVASALAVIVDNDKHLHCFFCPECSPVPHERIIAKSTKDGIKIHAVSCKALKTISLESLLEAHWQ